MIWSPQQAVERLGARTTYVQAQARLYCRACRACRAEGYGEAGQGVHVRASIQDYYAALRRDGHMS